MKTICIAGKNDIAVAALEFCLEHFSEHRIVCIVNADDKGIDSWQHSLKLSAINRGVDIISLEEAYSIKELIFVSLEFDRIIRPDRFTSDQLFNVHFSLLPKYKGCWTSVLPILHGECETGVTLHRIRRGIDTGEIIKQTKIIIEDDYDAFDLYKKMIFEGTRLIQEMLGKLLTGDYNSKPQESINSSYYARNYVDSKNLRLDVNCTAFQIRNQIRAFAFRPYQFIQFMGSDIVDAVITENVSKDKAGTILEDDEVSIKIASIDYDIILYKDCLDELIEAIEAEDEDKIKFYCSAKKLMNARDDAGRCPIEMLKRHSNVRIEGLTK